MSFNRRGGPDRRSDRPPRREGFGDRPDRPDRPGGRGSFGPRHGDGGPGGRGGDRPYGQRPRFDRGPDEGAMSIRLDPRRLGALKRLAGDAGMRPGDLVRQWVEERIDAERPGAEGRPSIDERVAALEARIAALERAPAGGAGAQEPGMAVAAEVAAPMTEQVTDVAPPEASGETEAAEAPEPAPADDTGAGGPEERPAPRPRRVTAAPSPRVALHDEMIAVLAERGPMTAAELAAAISERGRYAPPRSGRPLDAAMVSQRASNPTYRSRFRRAEGRIGLADQPGG